MKYFRDFFGEMIFPPHDDDKLVEKEIASELEELFDQKKKVGFNEGHGVGHIYRKKDGYVIEKYYYGRVSTIKGFNALGVAKWLIANHANNEPFSYEKAFARWGARQ